jgi:hypothetical protein
MLWVTLIHNIPLDASRLPIGPTQKGRRQGTLMQIFTHTKQLPRRRCGQRMSLEDHNRVEENAIRSLQSIITCGPSACRTNGKAIRLRAYYKLQYDTTMSY